MSTDAPHKPSSRQNGLAYTTTPFTSVPAESWCRSSAWSPGNAGSYAMWLASDGGVVTITRRASTVAFTLCTSTASAVWLMARTGLLSTTLSASSAAMRFAISCAPPSIWSC
jgi:hypothetical protein